MKKNLLLIAYIIVGMFWFYELTSAISTPSVAVLRWYTPHSAYQNSYGFRAERKIVPLSKISIYLQRAVIAAEDDKFFEHWGVDVEALKKAAQVNYKKKKFSRGASTLSMQIARNMYLSPRKTPFRKLKEILIAMKLERELSKKRLLEIYLNVVEWGNGIYGAEAASQHYFKKSAAALSPHEAAFLAAILPRPKFYDKHRYGPYLMGRVSLIESRI